MLPTLLRLPTGVGGLTPIEGVGVDLLRAIFANGEKGWVRLPGTQYGVAYVERSSPATICTNGSACGTYRDLVTNTDWVPSADARRPIYTVSGGLTYLDYDGSDDCLVGPTIDFSGTDKVTLIEAFELDTGALAQILTELSPTAVSNNGSFQVGTRIAASGDVFWGLRGDTANVNRSTAGAALPRKLLATCVYDLAGAATADEIKPTVNGAVVALTDSGAAAGGGNLGSYVPYIGARADGSLRFNGRKWGEICVGRVLTTAELTYCQQLVAGRAGITL